MDGSMSVGQTGQDPWTVSRQDCDGSPHSEEQQQQIRLNTIDRAQCLLCAITKLLTWPRMVDSLGTDCYAPNSRKRLPRSKGLSHGSTLTPTPRSEDQIESAPAAHVRIYGNECHRLNAIPPLHANDLDLVP